jgi:hypothetical protein
VAVTWTVNFCRVLTAFEEEAVAAVRTPCHLRPKKVAPLRLQIFLTAKIFPEVKKHFSWKTLVWLQGFRLMIKM